MAPRAKAQATLCAFLLGGWTSVSPAVSVAEPAVVVVNAKFPASTTNLQELRRVFLGKTQRIGAAKTVRALAVDSSSSVFKEYLELLGKTDSELRQYWARLVFTTDGTPPRLVGSDREVLKTISETVDAIGIIPASLVDSSVQVLFSLKQMEGK